MALEWARACSISSVIGGWLQRHKEKLRKAETKQRKQIGPLKVPFPTNLKQRGIPSLLSKADMFQGMAFGSLFLEQVNNTVWHVIEVGLQYE